MLLLRSIMIDMSIYYLNYLGYVRDAYPTTKKDII